LLQLTLEILSHKFTDVWSFLLQTHGIIITWFSLLRASFLLGIPTLAPTRDWSRDCIPKTCSEHISSRKFLLGHSVATSAEPLILSLPYVILEHPQAYLYNHPSSPSLLPPLIPRNHLAKSPPPLLNHFKKSTFSIPHEEFTSSIATIMSSTNNQEVTSTVDQARGIYDMKDLLAELSDIEKKPASCCSQHKAKPQTHASMPRYSPLSHAHPLPKTFLF
jgi:hypothetical protein